MSDLLGIERFISIEDLIERVVKALDESTPWGMTRWADASNVIMSANEPHKVGSWRGNEAYVFCHSANRLSARHYDEFRPAFLAGIAACDVLGAFHNDQVTDDLLTRHVRSLVEGKELVYAWCNKHVNARREWTEEVLRRPLRVALVGNTMPRYRPWLEQRFPNLSVVQCDVAGDWPDVALAMRRFVETRPQLALLSAGWFTSCLVGPAKAAGAVAFSYGHCPDYHLDGWLCPNTTLPRGPAGCLEYYQTLAEPGVPGKWRSATADRQTVHAGMIEQSREIEFAWRSE